MNGSFFADDLAQLADHVGAHQFYVAGMSGGGPYALAAAHYLPSRILGASVNCSAASVGTVPAKTRNLMDGEITDFNMAVSNCKQGHKICSFERSGKDQLCILLTDCLEVLAHEQFIIWRNLSHSA